MEEEEYEHWHLLQLQDVDIDLITAHIRHSFRMYILWLLLLCVTFVISFTATMVAIMAQ